MRTKYDFRYLSKKIFEADFIKEPFKHVYIENFFSEEHFDEILNSQEICAPDASNDKELIDGLIQKGFKPIEFPGCTTDLGKYIDWHENGKKLSHHSACGGFGVALRLYKFSSDLFNELNAFLNSNKFNKVIAEKFLIKFNECTIDNGIQKYLDGYEISPHPDIRKKAATFMVNINPNSKSEKMDHHTHYLKLKKKYAYIKEFWSGNPSIDRAWLPWDWAETVKQQTKNNSIVLFSPSNNTFHGVKASYNHLKTQRTQLYGNLWFKKNPTTKQMEWEQLDLNNTSNNSSTSKAIISQKNLVKKQSIGKRNI